MKKIILFILLIITSVIAQVLPAIPLSEFVRICERTAGTWNRTTGECICPAGFGLDMEKGCYNAKARDLCKKTNGIWFVDNTKIPPVGSCDCGLIRKWDDTKGCWGGVIEKILDFIRSLVPSYLFAE